MNSGLSTWCAGERLLHRGEDRVVLPGLPRRPRLRELRQPHLQPLRLRVGVQQPVQRGRAGARQAHHEDRPLDRYVGVLGLGGELRLGQQHADQRATSPRSAGSSCRAASARPPGRPGPRPGPAGPPRGRSPPKSVIPVVRYGGGDDVLVRPDVRALPGHDVVASWSVVELAAVDGQHLAGHGGGQVARRGTAPRGRPPRRTRAA